MCAKLFGDKAPFFKLKLRDTAFILSRVFHEETVKSVINPEISPVTYYNENCHDLIVPKVTNNRCHSELKLQLQSLKPINLNSHLQDIADVHD